MEATLQELSLDSSSHSMDQYLSFKSWRHHILDILNKVYRLLFNMHINGVCPIKVGLKIIYDKVETGERGEPQQQILARKVSVL